MVHSTTSLDKIIAVNKLQSKKKAICRRGPAALRESLESSWYNLQAAQCSWTKFMTTRSCMAGAAAHIQEPGALHILVTSECKLEPWLHMRVACTSASQQCPRRKARPAVAWLGVGVSWKSTLNLGIEIAATREEKNHTARSTRASRKDGIPG